MDERLLRGAWEGRNSLSPAPSLLLRARAPARRPSSTICWTRSLRTGHNRRQFMSSKVPAELKYAKSHEWLRLENDLATVGITDHAQRELTDITFIELPEVGRVLKAGETCATVESVKTASDIYAPVSGEVVAVNQAVSDQPELANSDPYGRGWFFQVRLAQASEVAQLLSPADYQAQIGE